MREPNTICVCSATKGALVNDFPCLHWSTAEGGVGGGGWGGQSREVGYGKDESGKSN